MRPLIPPKRSALLLVFCLSCSVLAFVIFLLASKNYELQAQLVKQQELLRQLMTRKQEQQQAVSNGNDFVDNINNNKGNQNRPPIQDRNGNDNDDKKVIQPILHFLNIKAENIFRTVLTTHYPQPATTSVGGNTNVPSLLVVEVGANDGKQAVWAAQQGYKVISFEPAPTGFRHCLATKEHAGVGTTMLGSVEFRNVAISSKRGEVHFIDNGVVSRIVNSSLPGSVTVRTATLSEEISEDIVFLKIDVEGHELAVFARNDKVAE